MLRDSGARHAEGAREIADRRVPVRESLQDRAASRVRQSREGEVELPVNGNHMVTNYAADLDRSQGAHRVANRRVSYARYCSASAIRSVPTCSSPARSAIVRATRSARWTARADMPPRSTAS